MEGFADRVGAILELVSSRFPHVDSGVEPDSAAASCADGGGHRWSPLAAAVDDITSRVASASTAAVTTTIHIPADRCA